MNGFDLIPASYRAQCAAQESLRMAAVVAGLVLLVGIAAVVGLRAVNSHTTEELAALTVDSNARQVIASKYKLAVAARTALREQGLIMAALQRRGATTTLISVVEQARATLPLWLKRWEFAGGSPGQNNSQRMQLRGDAQSHDALSQFVDALLAAPAVADVRIAAANERSQGSNIDFQLELELVAL